MCFLFRCYSEPASGPFSSFPNVDRTLAVLQGEMILHVENRPDVAMTAMSTPYRFPGDVATSATVIETVTDLNVMTRRSACRAGLARLERCSAFEAVGGETLLLLRDGARLANGQSLAPDDVLWLSAGETVAFSSPATLAWAIELSLSA